MKHPISVLSLLLILMVARPPSGMAEEADGVMAPTFAEMISNYGPIRVAAAEQREPQGFPAPPPGFPPPPPFPGGSLELAGVLSSLETAIGVRADQLTAWREFTDALQATLRPPTLPDPGQKQPFALAAALAADLSEKGKKAQILAAAIEKLKAQLTPEQLERAKLLEPPLPPRPGGK
jgi:hypothetical protein